MRQGCRLEADGAQRTSSSGSAYAPASAGERGAPKAPSKNNSSGGSRKFDPAILRMRSREKLPSTAYPTAATAGISSKPVSAILPAKPLLENVPPSQQVPSPRSVARRMARSIR